MSTRFSTIILLLSRRLGSTSSANMELLMSMAMMVSIPVRFSWLILVPICGRASMTTSSASTASRSQNLASGRQRDTPGMSWRSSAGSPNLRKRLRCLRASTKRMSASTGTAAKRYRYAGSSNLNMITHCFLYP